jgi:hypothetical protein
MRDDGVLRQPIMVTREPIAEHTMPVLTKKNETLGSLLRMLFKKPDERSIYFTHLLSCKLGLDFVS